MKQANWQKIEELFNAALELPTEERAAFLEASCAGDEELKEEVESLLENAETEDSFLGKPHLSVGLSILGKEKNRLILGETIGRYKIVELLGEGGMGTVYLAEDLSLNRRVALKLLPEYLLEDKESVARFQKEALAASAISHPNIAHIYEAGLENKRNYIAMEYVEGKTLRNLLKEKTLNLITALDIVWQTANALVAAHQAGIIHRDIKPENIMIRRDGYVKVLDFGIAKLFAGTDDGAQKSGDVESNRKRSLSLPASLLLTNPGLVMGTMTYISPEQLQNKNVDLRTDVWSLGVVLYEMLSGSKPFDGKTPDEVGKAILRTNPPLLTVSNLDSNDEISLQNIIAKTLSKDVATRYESAQNLANDLKELKQNLEFSKQFSSGEIPTDKILPNFSDTFKTPNSSFITKSKLFWNQQSFSQKALLLAVVIGFLTFGIGVTIQYFSRYNSAKFESFSPESRNRWQISTLYGVRLKVGGSIRSHSFSPDGKSIAFVLFAEGKDSIFVKRFNEADAKKITNDVGKFQTPVWSPDGKHIAFVTIRDNKDEIWTIPAEGGEAEFKTALSISTPYCELLKWSNDGKKMFFKSALELKSIDIDTGQIENIDLPRGNLGGAYSISPDESVVVFLTIDGEKRQLWAHNLRTRELNEITYKVNYDLRPAILPDNKRLIYSSNQNGYYQLYLTDFVSKTAMQLTFSDSNATDPLVSPDGRDVVYRSESQYANIFITDVRTKKEERITEATKMQLFPDLSKDGTSLVFQMTEEILDFRKGLLRIKNLRTKNESVLENQSGYWAKWSPSMDEIAFLRSEGLTANLWKIRLSDNQLTKLTSDGVRIAGLLLSPIGLSSSPFHWSSDGSKIVFVSNRSKVTNVCTIESNGTNLTHLTKNEDNKKKYNSPMWSPDERIIAYSYQVEVDVGKFQYGISTIADNQEKEIFRSESVTGLLGWSANRTTLLVSVYQGKTVKVLEISERNPPKIVTTLTDTNPYTLSLSPDRKKIAYSAAKEGITNIFLYSVNGKEQLTDNEDDAILFSGISWAPNGDRLFYSKQSGAIQISMISDKPEKKE